MITSRTLQYNMNGVSAWKLKLLRVQLLPIDGRRRSGDGGAAIVNSILLPSSKEGEMAAADLEHGEQPWSPFHSVLNASGNFREVIDVI
jgi:outer membrane protein assembly factor BamB